MDYRLSTIDSFTRRLPQVPLALVFLAALLLPISAAKASQGEYIIISGGPALRKWEDYRMSKCRHDKWWGNFVRAARMRVEELRKEHGDSLPITWLVYKPGYSRRASEDGRPLTDFVRSVAQKYNLNLVWFDSGQDFINYVNSGRNRDSVKIAGLEFFGHSNKHCWIFDYSNYILGASKAWFHETDAKDIKRRAFAKDPYIKSWGCHTAESMSERWRYYTKTRMWGAVGKTDYSYLWQGKLPYISSPGGRWKN